MTLLTADKLEGVHQYLADNYPMWQKSMASIKEEGGPWWCESCEGPSYLCYRCSRCGADLSSSKTTHGRES